MQATATRPHLQRCLDRSFWSDAAIISDHLQAMEAVATQHHDVLAVPLCAVVIH
jgi:hypothetical protein